MRLTSDGCLFETASKVKTEVRATNSGIKALGHIIYFWLRNVSRFCLACPISWDSCIIW
jgi:hypothetical protein